MWLFVCSFYEGEAVVVGRLVGDGGGNADTRLILSLHTTILGSPRASTFSPSGMQNALPPDNHDRIQIIDDEKQFTKELNGQVDRWGLLDSGFGYDVVAVFGSQSTGKSKY